MQIVASETEESKLTEEMTLWLGAVECPLECAVEVVADVVSNMRYRAPVAVPRDYRARRWGELEVSVRRGLCWWTVESGRRGSGAWLCWVSTDWRPR